MIQLSAIDVRNLLSAEASVALVEERHAAALSEVRQAYTMRSRAILAILKAHDVPQEHWHLPWRCIEHEGEVCLTTEPEA